jgi:HK97 family phage major capsid protein
VGYWREVLFVISIGPGEAPAQLARRIIMSDHGIATISTLAHEMKATLAEIQSADAARVRALESKASKDEVARISDELARKTAQLQTAVDNLSRRMNRPGGGTGSDGGDADHAAARGLLELKHVLRIPKADPEHPFAPTSDEIDEAALACKAMKHLLKVSTADALSMMERKALTSFQLGSSGYLLPPEWSAQILSCLESKTDLTGLVNNIPISGSSLKMFVDNADLDEAMWACDSDCFGAARVKDIAEGLGEIEIKPEHLRYIICSSRDIVEDASVDMQAWLGAKVERAFRHTVSSAIVNGSGIGKPLGILNPTAQIPTCDTSANTPAGQFTWQDLVMLKWQVAAQFHAGAAYLMNQQTFALVLTMMPSAGRS